MGSMKLIDLSQPLFADCPNCPGDPRVESRLILTHERDGWHLEKLSLASHTASHVDAPLHKIPGGKAIDEIPLDRFVGEALIADLRDCGELAPIDGKLLSSRLSHEIGGRIVLLATGWGQKRSADEQWLRRSPYLAPDGAQWLVERGARAVGIDHYSIGGSRDPDNSQTHEILLGAGLWVVEDLRFGTQVFGLAQPVEFWCLPLNLKGHSGAPCRPVIVVR